MKDFFKKGDALFIVDAQIDFFPHGALGVPSGDKIIPIVNEWINAAQQQKIPIFASRDWHPANHCSFKSRGGIWPPHCIQNSPGAKFHPDIHFPDNVIIIDKATDPQQEAYSAFKGKITATNISPEQVLQQKEIHRIWMMGLALDYCVLESALEAAEKGFIVHVILKGTQAIHENTGQQAIERLRKAGIILH